MTFTDKQKKWLIIAGVIAVVVIGSIFSVKALLPKDTDEGEVKYSTAEVVRGGVEAVGNLNASYGGGISVPWTEDTSSMSYKVLDVYVKSGDMVKSGQPILQLSAPSLSSQIEDLEKQIANERKSLADLLNLPIDEVDNADPSNGIVVTAPFNGRVVGLTIRAGQKIEDMTDSIRVVDDSVVKITANLTAYEAAKVTDKKTKAIISLGQFLGDTREAKIVDINRNPTPVASNSLYYNSGIQSTESGNEFVYNITLELPNPGLITPSSTSLANIGFFEPKKGYTFKNGDTPDGTRWCRYSAIVESYADEEDVSSGLTGKVTKVIAKNSSMVKKGDPIFAMAGTDIKEDIEKRQTGIRDKKAQLATYQMQAGNLLITAPSNGMISELKKKKGDSIGPGEYLGSVFSAENMSMYVNVDDTEVLMVSQGAPVTVTVDALPDTPFEGVVEYVSGMGSDENGVSKFEVYISVKGSAEIRQGMQARAYINAGSATDVLLIPQEAIFTEDDIDKVEVLNDDGTVSVVAIEVGLSNSRQAEVRSGLEEGQFVITGSTADMLPSEGVVTPGADTGDDGTATDAGGENIDGGGETEVPMDMPAEPDSNVEAVPLGEYNNPRLGHGYKKNIA